MPALALNNEKEGHDIRHDTFESNILKNVIRESWKESVPAKEKDREKAKETVFELDEHALNMRKILSSYDYEIASMPLIVANTSRMSKDERRQYLASMEAIAMGSSNLFGPEFANVIMVGMPKKAKDRNSASRYISLIMRILERRQGMYKRRIYREGAKLQGASAQIILHSSSIFRFFRKKRITSLKRVVEVRSSRIRRMEARADRYSYLLQKVREKSKT